MSVVLPTYNRSALLGQAIGSAVRQTFHDLEVIVCDDGSTDATPRIVDSFGAPVRCLRLPHTGRAGSVRNRGIEVARGELVAFLDDDDVWEPEKLARQIELLDGRPAVGLVFSDRRLLFEDGSQSEPVLDVVEKEPVDFLDLLCSARFPQLSSVVVRSDLIRRVGGFDESLVTAEDLDVLLRLARVTDAACVPEPLVRVRRHAGSLSDRSGAVAFENAILVLERHLESGGLAGSYRVRCRRTLSELNVRLAASLTESRNRGRARRAALRALRYAPTARSAWSGVGRAWLGMR